MCQWEKNLHDQGDVHHNSFATLYITKKYLLVLLYDQFLSQ